MDLQKNAHYDGLRENINEADWAFFGIPYDGTSSYRSGSRFAPDAIRKETLLCQETYSPYFNSALEEKSIADIGNLVLPYRNREKVLQSISTFSKHLIQSKKKIFALGGEHLITLPIVRTLLKKYPNLRIIQIDAHADMTNELFGEFLSHGTVMRRIHELIGKKRIYQFGIRSGSKEELSFAKNNQFVTFFQLEGYQKYLDEWKKYPLYLTVDFDGFDPSQIPGTGTPETGGIFFNDFLRFLEDICTLNIVGIDVNECAPRLDPTNMSTVFASKVIREIIVSCL